MVRMNSMACFFAEAIVGVCLASLLKSWMSTLTGTVFLASLVVLEADESCTGFKVLLISLETPMALFIEVRMVLLLESSFLAALDRRVFRERSILTLAV